jgi:riboflavin kinase
MLNRVYPVPHHSGKSEQHERNNTIRNDGGEELSMSTIEDADIDHQELQTLKDIARLGSSNQQTQVTTYEVSERLAIPEGTISRRVETLEAAGYLSRDRRSDEQVISITDDGLGVLAPEHIQLAELFRPEGRLLLCGQATDGLGKGSQFIALEGYATQFFKRLGYEPFEGTFNVELDEPSVGIRAELEGLEGTRIDGWESGDRSYGPVTCYSVAVETTDGSTHEPAHLIVPEETEHGSDQLELIADIRLRDGLDIDTGEVIAVHVK